MKERTEEIGIAKRGGGSEPRAQNDDTISKRIEKLTCDGQLLEDLVGKDRARRLRRSVINQLGV